MNVGDINTASSCHVFLQSSVNTWSVRTLFTSRLAIVVEQWLK